MNTKTREQRYFGFTGAAAYIGTSVSTIRRLADSGQIRCYRIGDKLCRFDRNELDALVRGNEATVNEINQATV
jgi:excisionase family DNA binding protein